MAFCNNQLTITAVTPEPGGSPTYVDLTVNDMTDQQPYNVTVSELLNPIEPSEISRSCQFLGLGVLMKIISCASVSSNRVRIEYDTMPLQVLDSDPNDALNPANYAITGGPLPVNVLSVVKLTAIPLEGFVFDLITDELADVAAYTLTVTNVQDDICNGLDPGFNTCFFTGLGTQPEVVAAQALDNITVRVQFNEPMNANLALLNPLMYIFNTDPINAPQISAISVITEPILNPTFVDITVNSTIFRNVLYIVTVAGVEDAAGNPLNPLKNQATFSGLAEIVDIPESELRLDPFRNLPFKDTYCRMLYGTNDDGEILGGQV